MIFSNEIHFTKILAVGFKFYFTLINSKSALFPVMVWEEASNPTWTNGDPGGCFTNFLLAFQDILLKFVCCRSHSSYENFKLKLCMCAQSKALGTHTKFQLEILTITVICGIVYFRKIILESLWNVSETTPSSLKHTCMLVFSRGLNELITTKTAPINVAKLPAD